MIGPLEETNIWTKEEKKVDIIFLLRKDHESMHKIERNGALLRRILDNNTDTRGLSFELVDWNDKGMFYDDAKADIPMPHFKYKVDTKTTYTCHSLRL